jgi:crotonobetaine/carnitine-CoA ligase
MMGRWDDKFIRAQKKWASWCMQEYPPSGRILAKIIEDKARLKPNHIVFEFVDEQISFEQLNASSNQAANGFLALGVKHSDNVALMLPNCSEFLYGWLGLNKIGAVNVPINIAQRGQPLIHQINHADCIGIVIHHSYLEFLQNIADQLTKLRFVIVVGSNVEGSSYPIVPKVENLRFDELMAHSLSAPNITISFHELSSILYTSGTTGPSKGVMMSHHYWYDACTTAVKLGRYTEDDVFYDALPFFHCASIALSIGPAILAEAKAVIVERFSVSRMLDDCRKYNCTIANYVGSIIPLLMKQNPRDDDADNPLRMMMGAAAPVTVWNEFEKRFNTQLLELYGLTECIFSLFNPYESRRPGSCGKAISGYNVKIVDSDDQEVSPGTIGEIITRPERPFVGTSGYYKMPEATVELTKNLWYHTGDLGYMDEDGYFYFSDRKKQAIRRRGENISSFEVEAAINQHDAVLESCVVGVPSELGEEDVKAVIITKPGRSVSEQELMQWCKTRIAYFAIPRYIAFRDSLPKTPSDRVEKYKIKNEGVTADCWDREKSLEAMKTLKAGS